jgi:hypothetical protein
MDRDKKLHGSRSKNLNQKERGVGQTCDTKFLFYITIFNMPNTGRDVCNDCFHHHCIIVRKIKGNWFPVSDINYWILLRKVLNMKLWI